MGGVPPRIGGLGGRLPRRLPRLLAGLVGLALYLYLGWWQPVTAPFTHDYAINWAGARVLLERGNLYDRATGAEAAKAGGSIPADDTFFYTELYNSFIQPPIGAIAALPFAAWPWPWAKLGWLTLNHVAVWIALALLWSLARWPAWWPEATALLLGTSRPLQICWYYGQGDGLIVLWLAVGVWALARARPRPTLGALALGAAATWKLSPIFLGLGLLKARRFGLAVGFGLATAVLLAAQFAVAGPESTRTFFADVLPQLLAGTTHYVNVSLPGWVVRLWLGPAYAYDAAAPPPLPLGWRLLQYALIGAVLALTIALSPARIRRDLWPGVVGLWLSAGVLVASVAWEHYQAWAIVGLPWALTVMAKLARPHPGPLTAGGGDGRQPSPLRVAGWGERGGACWRCVRAPAGLFLVAWALLALPPDSLPLEWRVYFPLKAIAGVLLVLGFGLLLRREARPEVSD